MLVGATGVALGLYFVRLRRAPLVLMIAIVVASALAGAFDGEPRVHPKMDGTTIAFVAALTRRICAGLSIVAVAGPLGELALADKGRRAVGLLVLGPFGVGLTLSGVLLLRTLTEIARDQPGREVAVAQLTVMVGRTNVLVGVMTSISFTAALACALRLYLARK